MPKNTLKVLWVTTLVTEEKKSNFFLKGGNLVLQKGTKESKLSLGSLFAVWEANEMCTFLAEYETLNNNKANYLISKLQISFIMLAKKRVISARSLQILLCMQNRMEI